MEYYVQMRKTTLVIIINILTVTMICSCKMEQSSSPEQLLSRAKNIAEVDPQGALLVIDSLHELYPRDIRSRREADTIEWQIEMSEAQKNMPMLDSLLKADSTKLQELVKSFHYSKMDEYQDYGIYEHHRFMTENNTGRCYLKTTINEIGELVMISFYSGKEAAHSSFTVTVDGLEKHISETDNISGFTDGGTYREFITINDNIENGVTGLIASCESEVIIRLEGESSYEYTMTMGDIQAFKETMELAKLLQEMHLFQIQTSKFSNKIEILSTRLGK